MNSLYYWADRMSLDDNFARLFERLARRPNRKHSFILMKDAAELLELVHARYPLCVVSARDEHSSRRFLEQYGLSTYDANVLSGSRALADYFEAVAADCGDAKIAANWVQVELLGQLNRDASTIENCPVAAAELGGLIRRILDNSISGKIAKQVFDAMWRGEGSADTIIEARGLRQVSDSSALETIVDEVISANAVQVRQYLDADETKRKKLVGFFVGQVMKMSKGQANPQMVNELLAKKLV